MIPCTDSGSRQLAAVLAELVDHARELLRVERVAPGALDAAWTECRPAGPTARAARARGARSRRRRAARARSSPRSACLRPSPAGAKELGPSRADDEHRHSGRPVDEVVDEVEQALVRPVQVLEDENERAALGDGLEEPPPGGERLRSTIAAGRARPRPARRAAAGGLRPMRVVRLVEQPPRRPRASLAACSASRVSRMPACALTISVSAQYVTPSP